MKVNNKTMSPSCSIWLCMKILILWKIRSFTWKVEAEHSRRQPLDWNFCFFYHFLWFFLIIIALISLVFLKSLKLLKLKIDFVPNCCHNIQILIFDHFESFNHFTVLLKISFQYSFIAVFLIEIISKKIVGRNVRQMVNLF